MNHGCASANRGLRYCMTLPARGAVAQESDRVDWLIGRARRDDNMPPAQRPPAARAPIVELCAGGERPVDRLDDCRRLCQPTGTEFAASHRPGLRTHEQDAVGFEAIDVA